MTKQRETKNLTDEELENIERYDYHNPEFDFPVWASQLKEALEKRTGGNYYIGEDCQFHLKEEL